MLSQQPELSQDLKAWQEKGGYFKLPLFDHQVFYCDLGDKNAPSNKTLLILHGFPESSYSFQKVVDGLMAGFDRIVLFDMVGYGLSDKPTSNYSYSLMEQADLAFQVWNKLGVKGGHLLSHDMGTSVLTEIVARYVNKVLPIWFSDGIESLTFTNGSMVLEFAKLRVMQKVLLSSAGHLASKLSSFAIFSQQISSAHGVAESHGQQKEGALTDNDVELLWENNRLQDGHLKNHLLIKYLNDRKKFEHTRWIPSLAVASQTLPVHICWGESDRVANVAIAHHLKNNVCPSATLTLMTHTGHFCQLGSPHQWTQAVLAFY